MSSLVVRRPYRKVTIGGQLLTQVISVKWALGTDQRYATAEVVIPQVPTDSSGAPNFPQWAAVTITAGANQSSASVRFSGKLCSFKYTLYNRRVTLICRGTLYLADFSVNSNPGGTDLSLAGLGQTDVQMVTQVLAAVGITNVNIQGTGTVMGTIAGKNAFTWQENQSALQFIEDIDQVSLGYSTYDTPGGAVYRTQVLPFPRTTYAYSFTEGVDIYRADKEEDIFSTFNRSKVNGYDNGSGTPVTYTVQQDNSLVQNLSGYTTFEFSSSMIERSADADPLLGVTCQDVATWFVQQNNTALQHLTFETPLDYNIIPGTIIQVTAPNRLGTLSGQTDTFYVQNVAGQVDDKGRFSQKLICLGGAANTSPIESPPVASFTIVVDVELVVVGSAQVTRYLVYCVDTSVAIQGTIASRAWSSAGTPATGAGITYSTVFTSDPSAQSITLTVTDSNGNDATIVQLIGGFGGPVTYAARKLYAASKVAEDYDATTDTWRTYADIHAVNVFATANGPVWAAGKDAIASSTDLATTPTTTTPFGSSRQVTSLWVETDVDDQAILAGSDIGQVALSSDAGSSWVVAKAAVPDGLPALRVAINGALPNQYFVLTASHCYTSYDAGATWITLQTAAGGEAFTDLSLSWNRSMISMTGGRLMIEMTAGTAQTFPASPAGIIAVTADILQDGFYAVGSDGTTYYTSPMGGSVFVAGAALPAGAVPQARSLWRDGTVDQLIYMALGTGGLWKSVDGFATTGGYYQLRKPGVGTSAAGADYRQVGSDGQISSAPTAQTTVLAAMSSGIFRRVGNGVWLQTGLGTVAVRSMASPKGFPDRLYFITGSSAAFQRSDDQGDTATDITSTLPSVTTTYSHVTHQTTPQYVAWVSCPDGAEDTVYISVNDSTVISDVGPGPSFIPVYYSVAGLWKSTDKGATWTLVQGPNKNPVFGTYTTPGLNCTQSYISDGPVSFMVSQYTWNMAGSATVDEEHRWANDTLINVSLNAGGIFTYPDQNAGGNVGIRGDSSTVFGFNTEQDQHAGFVFLPNLNEFYVVAGTGFGVSTDGIEWMYGLSASQVLISFRTYTGTLTSRIIKGNIAPLPTFVPNTRNYASVTWSQLLSTTDIPGASVNRAFDVNPLNANEIFAGWHWPNVYHTLDGGAVWSREVLPGPSAAGIDTILVVS